MELQPLPVCLMYFAHVTHIQSSKQSYLRNLGPATFPIFHFDIYIPETS